MRTSHIRQLAGAAIIAAVVALAAPAGALPPPGTDPPDPLPRPDLRVTALTVSPVGSDWSIGYTVANNGTSTAAATTLSFNGGPGQAATRSISSMTAGATRSGTLTLPGTTECFAMINATADSGHVVAESSETNNTRQGTGVLPGCPARYKVTAVNFKALDESGVDWTGSDEPYWIFNSVGTNGTATSKASQTYGGVDSGETWAFGLADSCVWGCTNAGAPAPFGIGLSVQLWESDLGHVSQTLYDTASFFQQAGPIISAAGAPAWVGTATTTMGKAMNFILGWADDDLLGTNTYAFDAAGLAAALPTRGTSFTDTRIYENSDAKYSLTMSVSRVV